MLSILNKQFNIQILYSNIYHLITKQLYILILAYDYQLQTVILYLIRQYLQLDLK